MTEKTAHGALLSAVSQYLEMMYDGDLGRFDAVFAPTAQLHGVPEGQVRVLPAAEYRRLLASRPSPKSKNAPRQQENSLDRYRVVVAGTRQGSRSYR